MQEEADKLKNLTSDNSRTKVVALGIGDEIRLNELNRIVSEPADRNVIQVYNFTSLHDVEDQMVDAICSGWYSFVSVRGEVKTRDWKTQDWKTREHHLYRYQDVT